MLTEFYFDRELFLDDQLTASKAINDTILEYWSCFGCFIYDSDEEANIVSAISSVHAKYVQRWQTALSTYTKCRAVIKSPLISSYDNFSDVESALKVASIKTALIADEITDHLGIVDGVCDENTPEFELLTPDAITQSKNFTKSKEAAERDILQDSGIINVWAEKFECLSKHSKVITIIDRYFIKTLVEDKNRGYKTALELFVELLSKSESRHTISIYSVGYDDDGHCLKSSIKDLVENVLPSKPYFQSRKLNKVTFSSCTDDMFRDKAHDRFIGFDSLVISLGKGMDLFRVYPISNTTFSAKHMHRTNFTKTLSLMNPNRDWVLSSNYQQD